MGLPEYRRVLGKYVLVDCTDESDLAGSHKTILETDVAAIAFDRESGTLHKHGSPELVESWARSARQRLRDKGFDDMADDIVSICGMIPVEELNKAISISGYCKRLHATISSMEPEARHDFCGSAMGFSPPLSQGRHR